MSTLRQGLLAEMEKRGESLSEYRDFVKRIERVAPNYHFYYVDADNDEVPFSEVYETLEEIEAIDGSG